MEKNDNKTQDNISVDEWMIRPCDIYKEEYNDCTSIKARFNQYFIFGELQDCIPWKRDYENCKRWVDKKDEKSKITLIEHEYVRRKERLQGHYNNDIWRKRKDPPKDWNKPLPEWIVERDKDTYLDVKARQMKGEDIEFINTDNFCSIM